MPHIAMQFAPKCANWSVIATYLPHKRALVQQNTSFVYAHYRNSAKQSSPFNVCYTHTYLSAHVPHCVASVARGRLHLSPCRPHRGDLATYEHDLRFLYIFTCHFILAKPYANHHSPVNRSLPQTMSRTFTQFPYLPNVAMTGKLLLFIMLLVVVSAARIFTLPLTSLIAAHTHMHTQK